MCAKREHHEVLQPLVELVDELTAYGDFDVRSLPWGGVAVYNATMENI